MRRWAVLAVVAACAASAVAAAPARSGGATLVDVRRPMGAEAEIDWTHLTLEVRAHGYDPLLKSDSKPLEQAAISVVDRTIGELAARVPVRADLVLGDANPRLALDVLGAWRVHESRYYDAGPVEVIGTVDLQPLAAGWQWQRATSAPEEVPGPTGLLIDARGKGVEPVLAPSLVDELGAPLYEGALWKDVAYQRAPVVWVSDPAHPEALRAGAQPIYMVAAGGGPGRVVIGNADLDRFKAAASVGRLLGDGAIVVVIDP
jgi:hypothetical protein